MDLGLWGGKIPPSCSNQGDALCPRFCAKFVHSRILNKYHLAGYRPSGYKNNTEWDSRACTGGGYTGRSIRTDTELWGNPVLPYFIKNGCCLSHRSQVILWMKTNSNISSGCSVIMQEWKSSAKVTNYQVNDVVFLGCLGKPGWVTRDGGSMNCSW